MAWTTKDKLQSDYLNVKSELEKISAGRPRPDALRMKRNDGPDIDIRLPYLAGNEVRLSANCESCKKRGLCPLLEAERRRCALEAKIRDCSSIGRRTAPRKDAGTRPSRSVRRSKKNRNSSYTYERRTIKILDSINGCRITREFVIITDDGPVSRFASVSMLLFGRSHYPLSLVYLVLVLVIEMEFKPADVVAALEMGNCLSDSGEGDSPLQVPSKRTIYRWKKRWEMFCEKTGHSVKDLPCTELKDLADLCIEGHPEWQEQDVEDLLSDFVMETTDGSGSLTPLLAYFCFLMLAAPFTGISYIRVVRKNGGPLRILPA